ncbi:hypothetical protein ACG9XP_19635, partial [Acinetobacter baumannii]|uniref:hypothetical protein n=1 Tax=Acinetobacter baumannii TaxID=470 RepID=UPI003AF97AD1
MKAGHQGDFEANKGVQILSWHGNGALQGVKAAEEAANQAAAAAQAAEAGGNAVETTSKAALAALRCSQVRERLP